MQNFTKWYAFPRCVYVNIFSKAPYKIVLQPHYMRKMELTFLMAVRLSVYAPILPFLIPTCGTMGDFFSALLKAFHSSALFGASTGLNLLNSRLPALHFAGRQGPWLWLSSLLPPSADLAFSFGRNTVCGCSRTSHSTSPISLVPHAWSGASACPNFYLSNLEGGRPVDALPWSLQGFLLHWGGRSSGPSPS